MYGSQTDSQGKTISADVAKLLAGEKVRGNKLSYIGPAIDKDGNKVDSRASFELIQENGYVFRHTFWEPKEGEYHDREIDTLNRQILHICTKFVTKDEYYAAVGGASSFRDFFDKVNSLLPKAEGKLFQAKITLKQKQDGNYAGQIPRFGSFFEVDGTEPSNFSTNPKYDIYKEPKVTDPENDAPSDPEYVF